VFTALITATKDEDMDFIYDQLAQDYGAVTFEAFINLMVNIPRLENSFYLILLGGYN